MNGDDVSIVVAIIASLGALLSFVGTIVVALVSVKNAQVAASDEISSGATQMLQEYRKELDSMRLEINELQTWKLDVIDFIIPFIEGSKLNERQLIDAGIEPSYPLPPLPEWIKK